MKRNGCLLIVTWKRVTMATFIFIYFSPNPFARKITIYGVAITTNAVSQLSTLSLEAFPAYLLYVASF